ncbi:Ig-like domain repeat protein [Solirubrobacter sp. CPCC 204708]|uniref:Ig-like domain-containing protein n=1 Tax=Solirubrobacter deserti TaxID=2282478 RepID=A0ABT4RFJ4_9ACTN|nr:Ig-like domain-containing protein [Solirubrobacter deserti]MBE2319421.1 Ig-like domain repeat protein [Solirubrobacter deserti]MDA0137294.1 Ig-like domain-containing protein [Solirubrobacter deserti]
MTLSSRWRRAAAAAVAAATVVPFAATADAAPLRTATTTSYQRADFLQRTLGVPANTVIDSVTYDRFQHLLRQPGTFALLIGDPSTDATFAARAVAVDAAARAAGAQKVYWFNPNFSGGVNVGAAEVPDLDIRKADALKLIESSRIRFRDAWQNLLAQSLGNGVKADRKLPGDQGQSVDTTVGHATEVNDSVNPLYDYTSGTAPADVADSFFVVYNTNNRDGAANDKVVDWVNLTDDAQAAAKVATAIANKPFATVGQFEWWQEEANERQRVATQGNASRIGPDVLTAADNAAADGGWRVNQVTYPEIVDILEHSTDADAAILFGGTWCPNTRAVLPFVNKEAQKNNVTVYNFDTVLDGGKVGGNPTGATPNPLQTRNPEPAADAQGNGRFASYLYGELVNQYLGNFVTEYLPTDTNAITYFPHGDTSQARKSKARLQVPYLFAYKGKSGAGAQDGVTRQWIHKGNAQPPRTHTEYMSNWFFTQPQPNKVNLGFSTALPAWQKINAAIAGFTWQTDVNTVKPSQSVYTDAGDYLGNETATVGTNAQGNVTVTSGGPTDISPAALSAALAALGANAPKTLAEARTAWLADKTNPNLTTVAGAWGTVDTRKGQVRTAFGDAATPNSIAGAAAAKHALDVFFGGLPGAAVATRKVTAAPVKQGTAATISLEVSNYYERTVSGDVALVLKQAGTTVASPTATLANGVATFALGALPAGTYDYTLTYAGNDQLLGFTETGSLTVTAPDPVVTPDPVGTPGPTPIANPGPGPAVKVKVKASKVAGAVSKAPTSKKAGKYKVTITTATGLTKATGKVTLTLKKGKTTKKVTGTLKNGVVTVTVPKLARGTWKVSISWPGDGNYLSGKASGKSIKVTK